MLLASFSFAQSSTQADSLIRAAAKQFSADFVEGNYEAMLDCYTEDAKIFPVGRDILEGESLRKYWLPSEDATSKVIFHKLTPLEIKVLGNAAYDYGYYEGKSQNEEGIISDWKGKYVVVWKEVEMGVWKMYLDIWSPIK